jgi:hypothetical protein
MNQFFYTRITEEKEFRDSFNMNKVIRTMTFPDGKLIVILDDFHEQLTQQPDINPKTNKLNGYKMVKTTMQSEIELSGKDVERFFKFANIENHNYIA